MKVLSLYAVVVAGLINVAEIGHAQSVGADREGAYRRALETIKDFVDVVCVDFAKIDDRTNTEVMTNAEANAEVEGLIKKLADLGVRGAVYYEQQKKSGILKEELLLEARKSDRECRWRMFEKLEDRLLKLSKISVNATMTPTLVKEVKKPFAFEHRRSSCSGEENLPNRYCLVESNAVLTNYDINVVWQRNGRIKSHSKDKNDRRCINVMAHVASGGRTGIGECRYHGVVNYKGTLTGTIKTPAQRSTTFLFEGDPIEIPTWTYDKAINREGLVNVLWDYTVTVSDHDKNFKIVLSPGKPKEGGYSSSINSAGTLVVNYQ